MSSMDAVAVKRMQQEHGLQGVLDLVAKVLHVKRRDLDSLLEVLMARDVQVWHFHLHAIFDQSCPGLFPM